MILTIVVGVCVLCGVLTVAATMLSSRMSRAGIVVQRGAKDVDIEHGEAYREEYAAAMRMRDGVGRR